MKRLNANSIGIEQGDTVLFTDFETDGDMWTGRGQRERRRRIKFSETYRAPPTVHVSISLWDIDASTVVRADIKSETVTEDGFDLVFRTWGDTRVARMRANWMAIGPLADDDQWELY